MAHRLIDERYRPLERRAVGGMGTVWRARDERTGEIVAIKRLHPYLVSDPDARRRLAREAAALEAVDHPAIIRPRGLIDDPDDPGLVMEFAEGQPLDKRLASGGPISPEEAVAIVGTVADALAVAHDAGIVHRDIKPANILVESSGAVHLVDFGIASLSESGDATITAPTDLVGTLRYTAPERLSGTVATARSDVWALGAVLYELLVGTPAVAGDVTADLLTADRHGPPDTAALPPRLARIVQRAMSVDPDARHPDAASFRDALADADSEPAPVDGEASTQVVPLPVAIAPVRPPTGVATTRRWASPVDRAAAAFFGGVLLIALVVAIGLGVGGLAGGAGPNDAGGGPSVDAIPGGVVSLATPTPGETASDDGNGKGKGKGHGKGRGGGD
jgi:serine/threonine-protein kinase